MSTIVTSITQSSWQQIKTGKISYEQAINLLIDKTGKVNLELLDAEVSSRFFKLFPNPQQLPPIIPLLLWRNCYYLGSPVTLTPDIIQGL